MGRRIRFLPGIDRSAVDAKPLGLQRHDSHHFDRYLFIVYLFHGTTGLKAIAKLWAPLTPGDRGGPHDRIRSEMTEPPSDPFGPLGILLG
jgi:hypothetical protein